MKRIILFFILSIKPLSLSPLFAQTIGEIRIHRTNVFDPKKPGENKPPYTWANKLHILTREHVVRRELLFKSGDFFDAHLEQESERNLRGYHFIRSVRIEKSRRGEQLDLDVYTQDTWTTDLAPFWGRTAGHTTWGALFRERNLLGRGKTLDLSYNKGIDNVGRVIAFSDPRVWGSRWVFKTKHTDFTDGFNTIFNLERPLYSLTTRHFAGFFLERAFLLDKVYEEGSTAAIFQRQAYYYEAYGGYSLIAASDRALRTSLGWRLEEEVFASTVPAKGVPLPDNRRRQFIKVGLNFVDSRYIAENYIGQFDRYEDFNLGWEAVLGAAYAGRDFGSDRETYRTESSLSRGVRFQSGHFLTAQVGLSADFTGEGFEEVLQSANINYYRRSFLAAPHTLVAHAEAVSGLRLRPHHRLVLGGNYGIRGYRANAFSGTRALLFNAESRWHWLDDFLHIVSIAPTLFWDAGFVWPQGDSMRLADLKHDVGFGLRFGFTRSASFPILRTDLSYALSGDGTAGNRWVFSISTIQAFGPSNNASKAITQRYFKPR